MRVRELRRLGLCSSSAAPGQHQRGHPRESGSARKTRVPERATGQAFGCPGGPPGGSLSGTGPRSQLAGAAAGGFAHAVQPSGWRQNKEPARARHRATPSRCRRWLLTTEVRSQGGRDPGGRHVALASRGRRRLSDAQGVRV
ncbi:hypothetical protein NDU88_005237 [Pleurodeles waltl]|uniref:Uncharacterized protein n=1 Tax=Pleurodeles waltl TaxID=8319 RepID=A0AAV7NLX3_PLEWA|nr:hypothetical protein NDU88_005237 [Pleurodeles waltl]